MGCRPRNSRSAVVRRSPNRLDSPSDAHWFGSGSSNADAASAAYRIRRSRARARAGPQPGGRRRADPPRSCRRARSRLVRVQVARRASLAVVHHRSMLVVRYCDRDRSHQPDIATPITSAPRGARARTAESPGRSFAGRSRSTWNASVTSFQRRSRSSLGTLTSRATTSRTCFDDPYRRPWLSPQVADPRRVDRASRPRPDGHEVAHRQARHRAATERWLSGFPARGRQCGVHPGQSSRPGVGVKV